MASLRDWDELGQRAAAEEYGKRRYQEHAEIMDLLRWSWLLLPLLLWWMAANQGVWAPAVVKLVSALLSPLPALVILGMIAVAAYVHRMRAAAYGGVLLAVYVWASLYVTLAG